jgi:DNA-binding transcriptional MerR regulator
MAVVTSKASMSPQRTEAPRARGEAGDSRPRKALTIGAVAKILGQEFDDISISKIRYLEDQKLLAPRRTAGGYRLYSQADVERLRAILRMQRDEFLPLRVIRQELATGDFTGRRPSGESQKRRAASVGEAVTTFSRDDLLAEAGVGEQFLRELQDFGIVVAKRRDGRDAYDETDLEIVRAAAELSKFGVGGRNLRVFKTSADREAALLEQLLSAQLRSRSQARRKEAVENLESLAAVCGHLKHLLLVRDLRRLKSTAE